MQFTEAFLHIFFVLYIKLRMPHCVVQISVLGLDLWVEICGGVHFFFVIRDEISVFGLFDGLLQGLVDFVRFLVALRGLALAGFGGVTDYFLELLAVFFGCGDFGGICVVAGGFKGLRDAVVVETRVNFFDFPLG